MGNRFERTRNYEFSNPPTPPVQKVQLKILEPDAIQTRLYCEQFVDSLLQDPEINLSLVNKKKKSMSLVF